MKYPHGLENMHSSYQRHIVKDVFRREKNFHDLAAPVEFGGKGLYNYAKMTGWGDNPSITWGPSWISESYPEDNLPYNIGMGNTLDPVAAIILQNHGFIPDEVDFNMKRKAEIQRMMHLSHYNSPDVIAALERKEQEIHPEKKKIFVGFIEETIPHVYSNHEGGRYEPPEEILKIDSTNPLGMKNLGYKPRNVDEEMSRDELVDNVMFTKIGKYIRQIITLAPMPHCSGSLDAITTAAMSHMLAVIPRNYQFADSAFQVDFAKSVMKYLEDFEIPNTDAEQSEKIKKLWKRNVSAAIGVKAQDRETMRKLYNAGLRSFRLYTVATDARMKNQLVEMVKLIKELEAENPDEPGIELFIGQSTSMEQLESMIANGNSEDQTSEIMSDEAFLNTVISALGIDDWNKHIHGFYVGNGGGTVCSTAHTGMAVNSVEMTYRIRNHEAMKDKSIIIEGGIDEEPLQLVVGADGLSASSFIVGLESPGGKIIYKNHKTGKKGKVYAGEASRHAGMVEGREKPDSTTPNKEGRFSIRELDEERPSMTARVDRLIELNAQVFVKCGVRNLVQLHSLGSFCTETEMLEIWGENWRDIPDVVRIEGDHYFEEYAKIIREKSNAPSWFSDDEVLKRYLNVDPKQVYYVIKSPLIAINSANREEGKARHAIG